MARSLTCIHKKAGFPVWEEQFTAVTGYLVNHSSSDIFDDTVTFSDPENVDFDVLHVILLTFWINFNTVRLKVEIHEIHPNLRNPVSLIGL